MSSRRVVTLVLLLACHSPGPHEADVVAAEIAGPPHTRIVTREHEEAASCDGTAGIAERLACIFGSTITMCSWLEIDSPELAAHSFSKDLSACQSLAVTGPRIAMGGVTTGFQLEADPKKLGRVGLRAGGNSSIIYVLDGTVVGAVPIAWPVVWRDVPTLDAKLVDFFSSGEASVGPRLLDYARLHGGESKVVELMGPVASSSIDRWYDLYEQLEDTGLKVKARASLHQTLRDERPVELVTGLISYLDVQPVDFTKLLAQTAEEQIAGNADWYTVSPLLLELKKRKHPAAGDLACRIYGMQVLSAMPSASSEYDEANDAEAEQAALALVAQEKAPCRWVQIALDNDPCSDTLRCLADGGLPSPDGEDTVYDEDTGEPIYGSRPLCSRPAASAALRALDPEDDETVAPMYPGPLLLAAGYLNGGVSKELLQRNARRMYRIVYPPAPRLTKEQEEYGEVAEVPCQRPRDLASAVCRLPLDVTEVSFSGCRLHIDDKAQVVRVEELKPK